MHKFTLASAILFISGAVAFAGPESLPSGKEMKEVAPAPTCDYTWTGFYLGVNVGYGWGNADTRFDPLPDPATFFSLEPQTHDAGPDGVIGGAQIGYNHQWGKFVLGAEADFQGSGMDGSKTISPFNNINGVPTTTDEFLFTREQTDWFGTLRGRVGFSPWCRLLVYGTGGLAYGNVHYSGDVVAVLNGTYHESTSSSQTNVGWTAGGGLEYALTHHWSMKVEYLYYDLGNHGSTGPETFNGVLNPPYGVHYNWETTANIVRCGLNFKF